MCTECLLSHLQKNIHSLLFEHLTDTEWVHGTSTVQNANYLSKNYHFSLVTLKGNEIDLPPCLNVPPSGLEIKFFSREPNCIFKSYQKVLCIETSTFLGSQHTLISSLALIPKEPLTQKSWIFPCLKVLLYICSYKCVILCNCRPAGCVHLHANRGRQVSVLPAARHSCRGGHPGGVPPNRSHPGPDRALDGPQDRRRDPQLKNEHCR